MITGTDFLKIFCLIDRDLGKEAFCELCRTAGSADSYSAAKGTEADGSEGLIEFDEDIVTVGYAKADKPKLTVKTENLGGGLTLREKVNSGVTRSELSPNRPRVCL